MVWTNVGLHEVRLWLAQKVSGRPSMIILGTTGTAASETDTALYTPVATTAKAFSAITDSGFEVQYEHLLTSVEGTGFSFREAALITNTGGTASISTVTFSRDTSPVVAKTDQEELQTTIVVELLNEEL